jgi:hypothetical protein
LLLEGSSVGDSTRLVCKIALGMEAVELPVLRHADRLGEDSVHDDLHQVGLQRRILGNRWHLLSHRWLLLDHHVLYHRLLVLGGWRVLDDVGDATRYNAGAPRLRSDRVEACEICATMKDMMPQRKQ